MYSQMSQWSRWVHVAAGTVLALLLLNCAPIGQHQAVQVVPTAGFSVENMTIKNIKLKTMDMSGT